MYNLGILPLNIKNKKGQESLPPGNHNTRKQMPKKGNETEKIILEAYNKNAHLRKKCANNIKMYVQKNNFIQPFAATKYLKKLNKSLI